MNRDCIRRHRIKLAWALIALLLTVLALRAGLAQWRELSQWRGLAEQAASLHGGPGLNLERLRQSAQARRIELAEVDAQGTVWQLRGQEQEGKGLSFELVVQP